MNKLIELGENIVKRECDKLGKFLGVTQEEDLLIGWYNDNTNNTKCYMYTIPYYTSYKLLKQAQQKIVGLV